jgi:hypothetical protein
MTSQLPPAPPPRGINEVNADFQKVDKVLKETDNIMLHPYSMFTCAVNRKFTVMQMKYLRQKEDYFADPEVLLKNSEIADIQNLNPAWWRDWYAELQSITVMHYVIEVVRQTAPKFLPAALQALPEKEEMLQERLHSFFKQLHDALGKTEDSKMRYLIYKLGRRLFVDWASTAEARQYIARWPELDAEREALYDSCFEEGSVTQQQVAALYIMYFAVSEEHAKILAKIPIYSAGQLKKVAQDLEELAREEK